MPAFYSLLIRSVYCEDDRVAASI